MAPHSGNERRKGNEGNEGKESVGEERMEEKAHAVGRSPSSHSLLRSLRLHRQIDRQTKSRFFLFRYNLPLLSFLSFPSLRKCKVSPDRFSSLFYFHQYVSALRTNFCFSACSSQELGERTKEEIEFHRAKDNRRTIERKKDRERRET